MMESFFRKASALFLKNNVVLSLTTVNQVNIIIRQQEIKAYDF